jgi:hypothetical protein
MNPRESYADMPPFVHTMKSKHLDTRNADSTMANLVPAMAAPGSQAKVDEAVRCAYIRRRTLRRS